MTGIIKTDQLQGAQSSTITVPSGNNLTVSGAFTSQGIDDNANATAITIDTSENVGIGTTSPTNKLHVKGTGAEQINLETSGGATTILAIALKNSANTWQIENGRASNVLSVRCSTYGETIRSHSNGVTSFNAGIALGVGLNNTASNVLDDYEEGTFTATAGNSVTLHSNYDLMRYTKIGKMVTITGQVRVNSDNNNAGFRITNFPFAHAGNTEGNGHTFGAVRLYAWDVPSEFLYAGCFMAPSTTTAYVEYVRDNGTTVELPSSSNAYIMFGYTYPSTG